MRLKLVVLPAPFGPMSATVSPSFTEKLTSWTARSPPKRLLRLRMMRASGIEGHLDRAAMGTNITFVHFVDETHDAGRSPKNHSHQDDAVHGQLYAAG